ncbi:type III secretion system chaperone [Noviherbaspirillum sp. CPCC 100848]|uniref:Type III secretion system chaperone n=1 Tax=Noviherbaspirillum album TaxID=3080276 RepID=A0ABU6JAR3_9BURK|nr:type III secretion system chaperone [Noviherbaspirillum sp. CPCC 100848]MEC4720744.1 type III secretion system chaperone [Noviherbaspirillum sp. CPCC 100848]
MALDKIITELGQLLGMPGLGFSGRGNCELVFDGHLAVSISPASGNSLMLASMVERGVPGPDAGKLEALMRGNHLWQATAGATLSMSEDRSVWLLRELNAEALHAQQLLNAVEQHVNTLEQWMTRLRAAEPAAAPHHSLAFMTRV